MSAVENILSGKATAVKKQDVSVDIYLLKYSLLYEKKDGRDCYSIKAVQSRLGEDICRAVAYDVSDSYSFADEIFMKLCTGGVFPITLCDAVCNLLG